jgi:DNA repair protein RecN (Recombination protein N)
MLRRISLRQFVIVDELEIDFEPGFTALTGETGAGKSILVDALQLALGQRADAGVVREGASRAEISVEFDAPASLRAWLEESGFAPEPAADPDLVLRRVVDAQGKSRAWINGSVATLAQLREVADHLVDIHGQHAWQSLTRAAAVRTLVDSAAGAPAAELAAGWAAWRAARQALDDARQRHAERARERERLLWQIAELEHLAPAPGEWEALNVEHGRRAHAQALIEAAQTGVDRLSEGESSAQAQVSRTQAALESVVAHDPRLGETLDTLRQVQVQLQDAAHTLARYLDGSDLDPQRLQWLDDRLSAWLSAARRHRQPPAELPALLEQWRGELRALDEAGDLEALTATLARARERYDATAREVSRRRADAAPRLARAITAAMQPLGLQGGRFEIALTPHDEPQPWGLESVEFLVAGHAGVTPRPLARVASGGELSRIALAVAVTLRGGTMSAGSGPNGEVPPTVVFDEVDAGIGGAVAHTVGQLMRQLGLGRQVLAVTHLAQVASQAHRHHVVSKTAGRSGPASRVREVRDADRVAEVARMLGSAPDSAPGLAHAREMLEGAQRSAAAGEPATEPGAVAAVSAAAAAEMAGTSAPAARARRRP